MKPYVKKFLVSIVCLSAMAASFVAGIYWHIDYAFKIDKLNFLSDTYVQAKSSELAMESLDRGDITKTREVIMSGLSLNILYLDDLMVYEEDEELKERSKSLLRRIAQHRELFPEHYTVSDKKTGELNEIISNVNKVLQKHTQ